MAYVCDREFGKAQGEAPMNMSDRTAFLSYLAENPLDRVARTAAYADWLEEQGEEEESRRQRAWFDTWAWVPPGESWLGGGRGEPGTKHFRLERGLWCAKYPVTQEEWQAVMGDNPSEFKGNPRYPVESVSWNRVQEFLVELNKKYVSDDLVYRLPSEWEWEYICRGGPISKKESAIDFYFARSEEDLTAVPTNDLCSTQANFNGNWPAGSAAEGPYLERPTEVGLYLPNPLGIYDLHGNVWEWTSSLWAEGGSSRVIRGGGWNDFGEFCAASYRRGSVPDSTSSGLGFRLLAVPSESR